MFNKNLLWIIALKEFKYYIISFRFVICTILVLILSIVSSIILSNDYSEKNSEFITSYQIHQKEIETISNRGQLLMAGLTADRAPIKLSIYAQGLEPYIPHSFTVSPVVPPNVNERKYKNPLFSIFTPPDFIFIVKTILSLIALLLVIGTISGEKEAGTLKLTLSYPISRAQLILGKTIGGYLALFIPFFASALIFLFVIIINPVIELTSEDIISIILLYIGSLLYIAIFFQLGILLSSIFKNTAPALLIGILIWTFWIIIWPGIIQPVAESIIKPVPESSIEATKSTILRDTDRKTFFLKSDEWETQRKELWEKISRIEEQAQGQWREQTQILQILANFSPAGTFVLLSTNLTKTGINDFNKIASALRNFQFNLIKFDDNLILKAKRNEPLEPFPRYLIQKWNPFDPSLSSSLKENSDLNIFYFSLLFIEILILFLLGLLFFNRYDIR